MKIDKLEKDGKIAVVYSPRYGGWSTYNKGEYKETLCMDAEIAQAVVNYHETDAGPKRLPKEKVIYEIVQRKCPDLITAPANLHIKWIPKGSIFYITRNLDQGEKIVLLDNIDLLTA